MQISKDAACYCIVETKKKDAKRLLSPSVSLVLQYVYALPLVDQQIALPTTEKGRAGCATIISRASSTPPSFPPPICRTFYS